MTEMVSPVDTDQGEDRIDLDHVEDGRHELPVAIIELEIEPWMQGHRRLRRTSGLPWRR